ncbi:MAG: 50S ribosomal protein L22 [Thermodesulfobacteriota bacterium]|nr:50S ribosomal protein L22 [Thermodesulfobacteriota bacterium]
MEARAIARYVRISPRKARLVADLIRGKDINQALKVLSFTNKKASHIIEKLLRSAMANASEGKMIDVDTLFVKRIFVDQGPTLKRFMARAMGRANMIRKRTSHITVILAER